MLKILINSYTCCPGMGSEQGMGWNWIVHLARYCELYVITEGEYREQIMEWMRDERNHEVAQHIHWLWNPVKPKVRRMCWNQGDWRFYWFYRKWQRKTAELALRVLDSIGRDDGHGIDVIHHLNMIGFREPGFLWKIAKDRGIPFVWGPVGGMKQYPLSYAGGGGLRMMVFLWTKNFFNRWQIRFSLRVRKAINASNVIISSIPDSYYAILRNHGVESVIIPETGCFVDKVDNKREKISGSILNVIWAGKFDFRKRLDIALRSIAATKNKEIKLRVYGTGNEKQLSDAYKLVERLGIGDRVEFMGEKSNGEVREAMRDSDLFLFTSVNEDTSTVVLESISNHLPVVCFDCCGMSVVVDDSVGRKVVLSNPKKSVRDFAEIMDYFYSHREELVTLADNCRAHARSLSWDSKVEKVAGIYAELVRD